MFVDIVGFTRLSSSLQPVEVVSLLHDLVSQVDGLLQLYPVLSPLTSTYISSKLLYRKFRLLEFIFL